MGTKYPPIPEELKPTEPDYDYYAEHHDLSEDDVNWFFKSAWEDFIDSFVKDAYRDYIREMKDERNEQKENGELVPPFDEWHEAIYDFNPIFENYIKHNQEEINMDFKDYMKDIVEVDDYFDEGE